MMVVLNLSMMQPANCTSA